MPVVNPNDSFILLSKLILILVQYLVFNSVHIHNDFVKCDLLLNISDHIVSDNVYCRSETQEWDFGEPLF